MFEIIGSFLRIRSSEGLGFSSKARSRFGCGLSESDRRPSSFLSAILQLHVISHCGAHRNQSIDSRFGRVAPVSDGLRKLNVVKFGEKVGSSGLGYGLGYFASFHPSKPL